ncbi:hypothetical protein MNBD_NITROSPINAE03-1549 [hydrothermal vent metagenome]|uniref:Cyclic nucleotide-binding domain-containing protein n=1 Tax=hydrothermal vent metagenome TaxID=652676 RepID=A0A3B1D473_9ZZZZ
MEDSAENSGEKRSVNSEVVFLLARMPELAHLGSDELTRLSLLKPRIYKAGEVLLDRNDIEKNKMLILLAGVCNIEKLIDVSGINVWVCVSKAHAPTVFGEVGVLASRLRIASVVATQRVVTLAVSEKDLIEIFKGADKALNNTLWGFAKLGLKRCRVTANSYFSLADSIFRKNIIDNAAIESQIVRLEALLIGAGDDVRPDKSLFNETGDCLEWLDNALALASYFKLMPDFAMPSVMPRDVPSDISICPLAQEALKNGESGKSVKLALADIMLRRGKGKVMHESQIAFFKEIIEATDDLLEVLPYTAWAGEALSNLSEAAKIIENLSREIYKELDAISGKAVERFGLPMFPASPEEAGEEADPKLVSYICQKMEGVKARLPDEEAFKKYAKYPNRPGEEVRNNLALAMYASIKYHPVMRFIMRAKCPPPGAQKRLGIFGNAQLMSGFFCMGRRTPSGLPPGPAPPGLNFPDNKVLL